MLWETYTSGTAGVALKERTKVVAGMDWAPDLAATSSYATGAPCGLDSGVGAVQASAPAVVIAAWDGRSTMAAELDY